MNSATVDKLIKHFQKSNQTYASLLSVLQRNNFEVDPQLIEKIQEIMISIFTIEDEVIEYRLNKILNETNPFINTIDPQRIRDGKSFPDNINTIFQRFIDQRLKLLQILVKLPNEAWDRTGVHATEGHLPFYEFVRRMLEKESRTIAQLTERVPLN